MSVVVGESPCVSSENDVSKPGRVVSDVVVVKDVWHKEWKTKKC